MDCDGLQLRQKVWLERNGQVALSDWRVQLLQEIDHCGSLAEAARRMDVPYKTAWYKLKEMEKALGVTLVSTQSGGPSGGGAKLTAAGADAVARFHELTDGVNELLAERFRCSFVDPTD